MLKKTIEYEDYNGEKVTEDFYFNLTKAECMELNFGEDGGLENYIRSIVNERDIKKILEIFKKIVLISYGKKSPDGKRFIKNDQIRDEFLQSPAYSDLFMELMDNEETMADFVNGIIPQAAPEQPTVPDHVKN